MTSAAPISYRGVRALGASDVNRVVTIDRAHTGHSRTAFFEKRFAAAEANPGDFVHIGVVRGGSLRGFILAHLQRGEFGRDDVIGVFDAVGVEPEVQERGVGQELIEELLNVMRKKGVRALLSQANWTNHSLMRFLDASGFIISPRLVLDRTVTDGLAETTEEV